MKKAKKKPVIINYIDYETLCDIHNGGMALDEDLAIYNQIDTIELKGSEDRLEFYIPTLEGTMRMKKQDVLIVGVRGELYPCKWDIFVETYEVL